MGEGRTSLLTERRQCLERCFAALRRRVRCGRLGRLQRRFEARSATSHSLRAETVCQPRDAPSFRISAPPLPLEPYYSLSAGAWLDYDGDGRPDILLADRFRGLRLYRNTGAPGAAATTAPTLGKWYYAGPFSDVGQRGFGTEYPPEKGVDLTAKYEGKTGEEVVWREKNFADGKMENLRLFRNENNDNAVVYLYREIDTLGALELPVSLGADDTLSVWLNGTPLWTENAGRATTVERPTSSCG